MCSSEKYKNNVRRCHSRTERVRCAVQSSRVELPMCLFLGTKFRCQTLLQYTVLVPPTPTGTCRRPGGSGSEEWLACRMHIGPTIAVGRCSIALLHAVHRAAYLIHINRFRPCSRGRWCHQDSCTVYLERGKYLLVVHSGSGGVSSCF